ncbi:MAG: hypothetical protein LBV48_02110 [Mycoplasmataceae bacterium]|nr:hypothetical protein [Mycoplasmataceae bacterium]
MWENSLRNYDEPKLLFTLNKELERDNKQTISEWQLRKIMSESNINAELACKCGKRSNSKNSNFNAPNLIKKVP